MKAQKTKSSTTKKRVETQKQIQDDEEGRRKHIRNLLILGAIIALVLFNFATGVISYGVMTVWCMGPPITGTKFAASHHYFRPGEVHYGPHMFASYYCTEEDARNDGLNPGFRHQ